MLLSDVEHADVRTNALVLSVSLFTVGMLSEVPFATLTWGFLVVAVQTWLGFEIYRRCIRQSTPNSFELLGMGFALGSLVGVVVDQLLVRTPFRDNWWWVMIPFALALSVSNRGRVLSRSNLARPRELTERLSLMVGLSLLLLVPERYWPLWIGVGAVLLAVILHRLRIGRGSDSRSHLLIASAAVIGLGFGVRRTIDWRPQNWWIKTADIQFFEALGFSLSRFGARDQVFAAGIPIKYHWASYAWTGMLDRIAGADEWVVITRLAPVIVVVALIPLVIALAIRLGLRDGWLVVTLALFILLNDFNFESFSMVFSYIWLLAAAISAWHCLGSLRPTQIALLILFSAAAFAAKSSNIVVVAGLIFGTALYQVEAKSASTRARLALAMGGLFAFVCTYLFVYRGSGYSELVEFGVSGLAQDIFGDIRILGIRPRVLAATFVLLNSLLIFIIAMFAYGTERSFESFGSLKNATKSALPLLLLATLLPTIGVLTFFVAPIHEQEEYFLHSFAIIGVFFTTAALKRVSVDSRPSRKQVVVTVTGAVIFALIFVALTPTNEGTTFAIFTRVILGSPVVLMVVVLGLVLLIAKLGGANQRPHTITCLLLGALTVAAMSGNDKWIRDADSFKREILSEDHDLRYLGDEQVIEAARLVERLTQLDDIIASNYFCEETWCPTNQYSPTRADWQLGGEAMTLVVYSQRRYLVNGYGFTWQNIQPPESIQRRIAWSLQPQPSNLQRLEGGVPNYFLRDLTMPCPCGELADRAIIGRTQRFELYDLSTALAS